MKTPVDSHGSKKTKKCSKHLSAKISFISVEEQTQSWSAKPLLLQKQSLQQKVILFFKLYFDLTKTVMCVRFLWQ